MNNVILIGRVGGEPEVRKFESGTVKAKLTLAVNRRNKKDEKPDWFDLEAWGKTAEVIEKYVGKGKQIAVKGHLKFERWADKQTGAERSRAVIAIDEIELLGSKNDDSKPVAVQSSQAETTEDE